jgi:hypothetical protein
VPGTEPRASKNLFLLFTNDAGRDGRISGSNLHAKLNGVWRIGVIVVGVKAQVSVNSWSRESMSIRQAR